jgi:hypothetical protein
MNAMLDLRRVGRPPAAAGSAVAAARQAHDRDLQFLQLLRAFRRHGGLARESDFLRRRDAAEGAAPIRFEWSGVVWLPWFQFAPGSGAVRTIASLIASELQPALDGWGLAVWFAERNAWLAGERPVDRLDRDAAAVHAAARADRFIVRG